LAGIPDVLISKSGYTGENGYEIYTSPEHARHLWKHIMDAGKEFNMLPVGLGARDSLRLEAGLYLYGKDIDENTSPIEANMEWIVKFNKNSDFIDRDYLYKQKQKGTSHKLKGFEMLDKGIPRHNYEIYNEQGGKIGRVTSGTVSPVLNKGIGMGYVEKEYIEPGSIIYIKIRKKVLPARIKKIPLHKN
jgi:aminomethyltransferase